MERSLLFFSPHITPTGSLNVFVLFEMLSQCFSFLLSFLLDLLALGLVFSSTFLPKGPKGPINSSICVSYALLSAVRETEIHVKEHERIREICLFTEMC